MAQADRITGTISIFSINSSSLIADVRNVTLTRRVQTVANEAVNDLTEYPKALRSGWSISGTGPATIADLTALEAAYAVGEVAVAFTPATGAGAYAGTGILSSLTYEAGDEHVYSVEVTGQGTLTFTPAGGGS